MDKLNEQLKALSEELKDADAQERQSRKSAMSRRGFVRTLSFSAIVASASLVALQADAKNCGSNNSAGCSGNNFCGTNTCTATANTCNPNECATSNHCGGQSGGNQNTCTPNTCDHGNTCASGNTCKPNTCITENDCNGFGGNHCLT